ncbi:GL19711 [Drosophila persimilis]|uniref:GL19711 n=1 Tax=Drosophila persimilis TaxID=7234 RepID=B4IR68_DROPE|nr:GL19711 [Drosophila persimilis]
MSWRTFLAFGSSSTNAMEQAPNSASTFAHMLCSWSGRTKCWYRECVTGDGNRTDLVVEPAEFVVDPGVPEDFTLRVTEVAVSRAEDLRGLFKL